MKSPPTPNSSQVSQTPLVGAGKSLIGAPLEIKMYIQYTCISLRKWYFSPKNRHVYLRKNTYGWIVSNSFIKELMQLRFFHTNVAAFMILVFGKDQHHHHICSKVEFRFFLNVMVNHQGNVQALYWCNIHAESLMSLC